MTDTPEPPIDTKSRSAQTIRSRDGGGVPEDTGDLANRQGASQIMRLAYLPYFALFLFAMSYVLLSFKGYELSKIDKVLVDFTETVPLMIVGYIFGVLGGVTRSLNDKEHVIEGSPFSRIRLSTTFVAGALGMMTYFAMESGALVKLVYPDIPSSEQIEVSFKGVALAAFLVGFFAGETLLAGKKRVTSMANGHGDKNEGT